MDTVPAGDIAQEEAGSDESWAPIVARLCFAAAEEFQKADKGTSSHTESQTYACPSPQGLALPRANTWKGRA